MSAASAAVRINAAVVAAGSGVILSNSHNRGKIMVYPNEMVPFLELQI
jgi:hypothetical protein